MRLKVSLVVAACGVMVATDVARSQPPLSPPGATIRPQVLPADRHDRSPALRDLPQLPPAAEGRQPLPPRSVRRGPGRRVPSIVDPALQTTSFTAPAPATLVDFEGVNNVNGVLPPDTNGDIGPNHYVQWVNLSFSVFSRTGALLYGPAGGKSL